ncbi:MAG: phage integrase SAM-like domain-containing protein, partial [Alistipes sp.]
MLSTQYYVTADDMTRKLKIKNETFVDATNNLIKKYRDACNRAGDKLELMTVEQVVDLIQNNYDPSTTFDLDFIAFGRSVADKLMNNGRVGNSRAYTVALNSLVRFTGRECVSVNEITAKFLQSYVDWINASPARPNREKGGRAVSSYTSVIRALHNMAKAEYNDEDMGVIRIPFSPFAKFKLPRV